MHGKHWLPLPDKISPIRVELAKNGLAMSATLPRRAVRVGVALLEHYNRKTGRCDPGVKLLMRGLSYSKSTVIRALNDLCSGRDPHFHRCVHGGNFNTNAYTPNFVKLSKPVLEYQKASGIKKAEPHNGRFQKVGPARCQAVSHSKSQLVKPKPVEEPIEKTLNEQGSEEERREIQLKERRQAVPFIDRKRHLSVPSRSEVASDEADRRLTQQISENGLVGLYQRFEAEPELYEKAKKAERHKHGAGTTFLIASLK